MNRRTKALQISPETKRIVYERDHSLCIICGAPGCPWCHFIPRSQSGLGIEQNVVTMCNGCHTAYDQTTARSEIGDQIADYLRSKYDGWDEIRLTYRKE